MVNAGVGEQWRCGKGPWWGPPCRGTQSLSEAWCDAGRGKGRKRPRPSVLLSFHLLLHFPLAPPNRKPESKGSQVTRSIEVSLLGPRRAGEGPGGRSGKGWHVPLLSVILSWNRETLRVVSFLLPRATQVSHGDCCFLTLVYPSLCFSATLWSAIFYMSCI